MRSCLFWIAYVAGAMLVSFPVRIFGPWLGLFAIFIGVLVFRLVFNFILDRYWTRKS